MTDQADRRSRHAEAELDLRAHGHPLDERAQRVDEEGVALVAAVVAHLVAQQAGRDAEADPFGLPLLHGRGW